MMWYGGGHQWGWGLLMMGGTVLIWAALVFAAVWVARRFWRPEPDQRGPEQILAERYAAGQIDDDEYRHRLETVRGSAA